MKNTDVTEVKAGVEISSSEKSMFAGFSEKAKAAARINTAFKQHELVSPISRLTEILQRPEAGVAMQVQESISQDGSQSAELERQTSELDKAESDNATLENLQKASVYNTTVLQMKEETRDGKQHELEANVRLCESRVQAQSKTKDAPCPERTRVQLNDTNTEEAQSLHDATVERKERDTDSKECLDGTHVEAKDTDAVDPTCLKEATVESIYKHTETTYLVSGAAAERAPSASDTAHIEKRKSSTFGRLNHGYLVDKRTKTVSTVSDPTSSSYSYIVVGHQNSKERKVDTCVKTEIAEVTETQKEFAQLRDDISEKENQAEEHVTIKADLKELIHEKPENTKTLEADITEQHRADQREIAVVSLNANMDKMAVVSKQRQLNAKATAIERLKVLVTSDAEEVYPSDEVDEAEHEVAEAHQ